MRIEEEKDCSIRSSEVLLYRYVVKKKKRSRCCRAASQDERRSLTLAPKLGGISPREEEKLGGVSSREEEKLGGVLLRLEGGGALFLGRRALLGLLLCGAAHSSYAEVDHDLAYDEVEPELVHSSTSTLVDVEPVHSSYVETLM